jgi:hypothetical protein
MDRDDVLNMILGVLQNASNEILEGMYNDIHIKKIKYVGDDEFEYDQS